LLEGQEEQSRPIYIETGVSEPRYWVEGHKRYPYKKVSERYGVDPETSRVFIREEFLPQLIAAKDRVLQLGRWKLVWYALEQGTRVDLFDRIRDPLNRRDVSERHPEIVDELSALIAPFLLADGITLSQREGDETNDNDPEDSRTGDNDSSEEKEAERE
ncbi:MAG: hypothetical protein QGG40_09665, partial [Myxococcota bacterium]|nr:hypothetical protein [Myxococcota bacterium]